MKKDKHEFLNSCKLYYSCDQHNHNQLNAMKTTFSNLNQIWNSKVATSNVLILLEIHNFFKHAHMAIWIYLYPTLHFDHQTM